MLDLENLIVNEKWEEVFNLAESVKLPIIAIPTYLNRKKNNLKELVKLNAKVYLFVYKDDRHNYAEFESLDNVKIVEIDLSELPYRGITPKRKFIVDYFVSKGIDKILMLDDDLSTDSYCTRKEEGRKTGKRFIIPLEIALKIMLSLSNNVKFGVMGFSYTAFINFWNRKSALQKSNHVCGVQLLNLNLLSKAGVNFDTELVSSEDHDLSFQCWLNDLPCYVLPFVGMKFTLVPGGKDTIASKDWTEGSRIFFRKWKGMTDIIFNQKMNAYQVKHYWKKILAKDYLFKDDEHEKRYVESCNILDGK